MNNLYLNLYIKFQLLIDSQDGQDMIEYALAAALVSLASVAGTQHLAVGLNSAFNNISTKLAAHVS